MKNKELEKKLKKLVKDSEKLKIKRRDCDEKHLEYLHLGRISAFEQVLKLLSK